MVDKYDDTKIRAACFIFLQTHSNVSANDLVEYINSIKLPLRKRISPQHVTYLLKSSRGRWGFTSIKNNRNVRLWSVNNED